MIDYKKCNCNEEYWEEIVVQKDPHFQFKNVIYYHCSCCSEDFRIEEYETNKEIFFNDTYLEENNS